MKEGEKLVRLLVDGHHYATPEEGDIKLNAGRVIAVPLDVANRWIEQGIATDI